ncbi:choice-of-anchor L domain-containing protein [Mesonia ostreae]|uniref:Choice-of-anchor L domain-containing protein n=1 Tax=Mesonia ostreae TaxID=861110 RepID=A0ABU2KKP9_9FLAO|nr:choice-of-anchor L domain-containing protein [Mesonia ostreae]MDT0295238.1 choice-of-anchor L domain-containing protein [Mesonia ostreae]
MKKLLYPLFLLLTLIGKGQSISIDQNNNPEDLVNILLDNACVDIANSTVSSLQSVSYFNNNSGEFPISEGVIIRNGNASFSAGSYTGENLSSQENNNSDVYLAQLNNASGQTSEITDVAFLEFEFTPLSSTFSFDFLFASNEYGQWQCVSSDVFAFLLTDLTTGVSTNLAVIPQTQTPVSVKNIKDHAYNNSCLSDNASFFDVYNVNQPQQSTVNMRGYTQVMNASAQITPGNTYKIRLVIGDSTDSNFDSAIFLAAGSFNANVDLGEDSRICQGGEKTLSTGLSTQEYSHIWKMDEFVIPGQNGNSLTVSNPATYSVVVSENNSGCVLTDEIILSEISVQAPEDLNVCYEDSGDYTYNLLENSYEDLDISAEAYEIVYYASQEDLNNSNPIPTNQIGSYNGQENQIIYIKLISLDANLYCDEVYSFQLLVNDPIVLNVPNIELCDNPNAEIMVDLNQNNFSVVTNSDDYFFFFYTSYMDAQNDSNPIENPGEFLPTFINDSQTIWVKVEDRDMPNCFQIDNFDIIVNPLPLVDQIENVIECSEYILPPITHGNYYTDSQGTGEMLFAGDIIDEEGTYYIYNGPDANGCSNETSFTVILIELFSIKENYCGQMIVHNPTAGNFYTEPGGPSGNGEIITQGTTYMTNQTLYFYAEVNGVFCKEEAFPVNILPLPPVDTPLEVVTCNSYTLPVLENGMYFTQSGGTGTQKYPGDAISSSQALFVFNDDGTCTNEHSFQVYITPDFQDLIICGTYNLPSLEIGGYFTQPGGNGESIPEGEEIIASQNIYYYAQTTTTPNCTENEHFYVDIRPIPPVDSLEDVLVCVNDIFVLPSIVNGQFFTEPNREGDQLFEGDAIAETATIYINNLENSCTNETSFMVEVLELPPIENFTDVYSCEAYELSALANGSYYTLPNGGGQQLFPGDLISNTQEIFIYNSWPQLDTCDNQDSFTIYIEGIDLGEFEDVAVCDTYILPTLQAGKYFTQSGGEGNQLQAGLAINTSQQIFIYAINGDRFTCESEASFHVEVTPTPSLEEFETIESCGSFDLSLISLENAEISFYSAPNQQGLLPSEEMYFKAPGTYTVYAYASAEANSACGVEKMIEIIIYPSLPLYISDAVICKDPKTEEVISSAFLASGLPESEFEVYWYFEGNLVHTGENYETSQTGEYTVQSEVLYPISASDCGYKTTVVKVTASSKPIIKTNITEPFKDVAVIHVTVVDAIGEMEYQLNNGAFQESNEFYDVASGVHTITVRGIENYCGETTKEVEVIKYPKFFTPNSDGVNDFWNIKDLKEHPEAQVYIFDRFGKLITTLSPRKRGWDGSLNGKNLPSNDYWFQVVFTQDGNQKAFKSHFTLKR